MRRRLLLTLLAVSAVASLCAAASARLIGGHYGGTLTVGLTLGDPDTLDPTLSRSTVNQTIFPTFCEKLYDLNGNGRIAPQLASSLPSISTDKLTYTVPLRKGILFNDGTPFNAQAVVTTIERDQTLPGSRVMSDLSPIASVTAPDPYTVVFHLTSSFSPLTYYLEKDSWIMSPAQLARLGTSFGTNPVCVGPFMFDHWSPGDNLTVIKSPFYYDKYAVHLDKIVFRPAASAPAATAALQAGDLQAVGLDATLVPAILQNPGLRVIREAGLGFVAININIGNKNGIGAPYTNVGTALASSPPVRLAFEEAIDRRAVAKLVLGDPAEAGCTPISPVDKGWYDGTIKCVPYDPASARKLLAASGLANVTVHLLSSGGTSNEEIAQIMQAEEAAVGINVVIDPAADQATVTAERTAGKFDAAISGNAGSQDPDAELYTRFDTSGSNNYGGYSNPRVDLLLANARKATSKKVRLKLYHVAEQIVVDGSSSMIYLYHLVNVFGVSQRVTGVHVLADGSLRVAYAQYP